MPNVMASFFQRRKINPKTPVPPKKLDDMEIGNEEKKEEYPGNISSLNQLPSAPTPEQVVPRITPTPEVPPQLDVVNTPARAAARRALGLGFASPEDVSGILTPEEMENPEIRQNEPSNIVADKMRAKAQGNGVFNPTPDTQDLGLGEMDRSSPVNMQGLQEEINRNITPTDVPQEQTSVVPNQVNIKDTLLRKKMGNLFPGENPPKVEQDLEGASIFGEAPPMEEIQRVQAPVPATDMDQLNRLMQQMGYGTYAEQKKQQSDMLARSESMEPTDADRRLQYGLGAIGDVGRASTEYLQAAGTSPFGKPDLGRISKGYENYGAGTEKVISEKQKMADQLRARAAKITTEPMEAVQGMYKTLGAPDELNKIRVGNLETQAKTGLAQATTTKTVEDVKQELLDNDPKSPNSANFRNFVAEVFPQYTNAVKGMSKKSILATMPVLRDLADNYAKANQQKAENKPLTISSPSGRGDFAVLKLKSEPEAAKLATGLIGAKQMAGTLNKIKEVLPKGGLSLTTAKGLSDVGITLHSLLGQIALDAKNYYGFGAAFTGQEIASTFRAMGLPFYSVDDRNMLELKITASDLQAMTKDGKAVKRMIQALDNYRNNLREEMRSKLYTATVDGSQPAVDKELQSIFGEAAQDTSFPTDIKKLPPGSSLPGLK